MKRLSTTLALIAAAIIIPQRDALAQIPVSLIADRWTATDSARAENYLGRPSLYMSRGVALAPDANFREGTIELDLATPRRGNFMGVVFHATSTENSEVILFRPGSSGTLDAMQYSPALNGVAAAWKVYQWNGAMAAPELFFDRWLHIKIDIAGVAATVYLNGDSKPTLTVPHLAGVDGGAIGIWTGGNGKGAYVSNFQYTPRERSAPAAEPMLPSGTLDQWELSEAIDAPALTPGALPKLSLFKWEKVHVESQGFVLINRYRRSPAIPVPLDPATHEPLADSVMNGRVAGSKVVLARTIIVADHARYQRMLFGYSDGAVVYCNGQPLFLGMSPFGLRRDWGYMKDIGDAVYLPLKKGRNEVVFAVTSFFGGWAFWARLDERGGFRSN